MGQAKLIISLFLKKLKPLLLAYQFDSEVMI
jgi:hypothetical protein